MQLISNTQKELVNVQVGYHTGIPFNPKKTIHSTVPTKISNMDKYVEYDGCKIAPNYTFLKKN